MIRYLAWALVCTTAALVGLGSVERAFSATITDIKPGVPVGLSIPDTDLKLSGCVAPNSFVTMLNGSTVTGTTVAGATGLYTKKFVSQTPGIQTVQSFFEDSRGDISSTALDLVALPIKTLTEHTQNPSPTIRVSPGAVTVGSSITFSGYTCPGTNVVITIDGNLNAVAVANTAGYYEVSLNTFNFFIGAHSFTVSSNKSGYGSKVSQKYQFIISASPDGGGQSAGTTSSNAGNTLGVVPEITSPADNYTSGSNIVLLGGTATPNSIVEIYVNGELVGSVFSNALGEWTAYISLRDEVTSVKTRSCNASECGDFSDTVRYFLEAPGECEVELRLKEYRFNTTQRSSGVDIFIDVSGESGALADLTIDWGDIDIDHQSIRVGDNQKLHHAYNTVGNYNGNVTASVSDNCYETVYFTAQVTDEKQDYRLPIAIGILFIGISLLKYVLVKRKRSI